MSDEKPTAATYDAGCHCGFISLSLELSPPLPEHVVVSCNCSICRRAGYLLVYPTYEKVTWHNGSDGRVGRYSFNTKTRDHMFCPKCGASIGIDFKEWGIQRLGVKKYGISARQINDIDLDELKYRKFDGKSELSPGRDLSGEQFVEGRL